jgi:hypothetical protein
MVFYPNTGCPWLGIVTGQRFFELPHLLPAAAPLPLPPGWGTALSGSTGATYFVHADGRSQFELPL